jgi:RNA polymerase sigma factor (sigma-70 family)
MEICDYLFRHEAGRMVAVLTRIIGVNNLALAEDAVQDAFCRAVEVWRFRGVPENPSAWLMATAKNRAIDMLRQERTAQSLAPKLARDLEPDQSSAQLFEMALDTNTIEDDQLRLMFSCCHPRLREEAQVALVLYLLCGFNVDEVAAAFLASHAAMEKRIARAKNVLKGSHRLFDLSDADFSSRLSAVHRALYLLFNEGYHGASAETPVRVQLCLEAIRLAKLLSEHPLAATPATHALAALMCLDAARLPARVDAAGGLTPLYAQDRSLWDGGLMSEGLRYLDLSAVGPVLTEYHVEAAIAAVHAGAHGVEDTDWGNIVSLYDLLMTIRPSPVVALSGHGRLASINQMEFRERALYHQIHLAPRRDGTRRQTAAAVASVDESLLICSSSASNPRRVSWELSHVRPEDEEEQPP